MNGWVGLQPLRVQALMTKLQVERSKLADLESRVLSVQNNLSWEIASKGDVSDSLQRARNKIRRRGELLSLLEGMLREAVDSFDATDRKGSEAKNALSYWASMAVGGSTILTSLTSLGMSCGDRLFEKFGSVFGTGNAGSFVSNIFSNIGTGHTGNMYQNQSVTPIVDSMVLGTPDPTEFEENHEYEKLLRGEGTVFIDKITPEKQKELVEYARKKGLNGEKPNSQLFFTNREAYDAQYEAWRSTFTEEEWAEYKAEKAAKKAEREAEKEANKPFYQKIGDRLGDAGGGVVKAAKSAAKKAEKKIDAAGEWIEDKAEWVGEKAGEAVEWAGEKIEEGIEDFKVNWNGLSEEISEVAQSQVDEFDELWEGFNEKLDNYAEEHPMAMYVLETAESGVGFLGTMVSGAQAFATGNPIKGISAGYAAWNKLMDTGQNANATLNQAIGYAFDFFGEGDIAQEYYDYAAGEAGLDGLAGQLGQIDGKVGDVASVVVSGVDNVNAIYSGITGIASITGGIKNVENVKDVGKLLINWKTSDGTPISHYDALFSNTESLITIKKALLEGNGGDILKTVFKPIKSTLKIGTAPINFGETIIASMED